MLILFLMLPFRSRPLAALALSLTLSAGLPQAAAAGDASATSDDNAHRSGDWIRITSKRSLANLESIDSFGITEQGTLAARLLLSYLTGRDPAALRSAQRIYAAIIPKENHGGDYTALQWFSEVFLADTAERKARLQDPLVASYFRFFTDNDHAVLKEYLQRKYHLKEFPDQESEKGRNRSAFLEDSILFSNPRREQWEKTSAIVERLGITPGSTIADIGSGPGYYSFKFARRVGPKGRVFAIDTVKQHLDYINRLTRQEGISTITTVHNHNESLGLAPGQKVDLAFMCSLYHIIYIVYRESARETFLESIKSSLKPDGRLVIVDNAVVEGKDPPYHGPYIAKELVIAQLKHYGFELVDDFQATPQRYLLSFRLSRGR